jgi:hypothetical protein
MKKYLLFFAALFLSFNLLKAQLPAAMNFDATDCNGQMHHLYSELDANNVVILEFMMLNCSGCIVAADEVYPMYNNINAQFPGRIKYYLFGFSDAQPSYSCSKIQTWVTSNGFPNMVPFDSGATQVAYYGGMGMPTIAVVAGADHKTLYLSNEGFDAGDSAVIGGLARNFLKTTGIEENNKAISSVQLSPNPATDNIQLNFNLANATSVNLQVVNLLGEKVQEMNLGNLNRGQYKQEVKLNSLEVGIYFLQLRTDDQQYSEKFVIAH